MQIVEILLPCTKPIIIINIYRPPSGIISEAIQEIQTAINNLDINTEVFVIGDFNIDYNMNSASYKKLSTFETKKNLTQYIVSYTRITNKSATIVDHAYTNSLKIIESGVIDINMSDHYAIFIIRKKTHIPHNKTTFTCRATKYFDREIFCEILKDHNWNELYTETDTEKGWNILISFII